MNYRENSDCAYVIRLGAFRPGIGVELQTQAFIE
jgi:hypothetical protein